MSGAGRRGAPPALVRAALAAGAVVIALVAYLALHGFGTAVEFLVVGLALLALIAYGSLSRGA